MNRPGFSLMEVLLALSILLACLTVLGQMAMVGRKHAEDAEQLTSAQLIGRSQLSAILAGAAPLASRTPAELAELPGWWSRVDVETLGEHGLVAVRVTVSKGPGEAADGAAVRLGKQFTLVRWMYAPEEGAAEPSGELSTEPSGEPSVEPAAPLGVVGEGP